MTLLVTGLTPHLLTHVNHTSQPPLAPQTAGALTQVAGLAMVQQRADMRRSRVNTAGRELRFHQRGKQSLRLLSVVVCTWTARCANSTCDGPVRQKQRSRTSTNENIIGKCWCFDACSNWWHSKCRIKNRFGKHLEWRTVHQSHKAYRGEFLRTLVLM